MSEDQPKGETVRCQPHHKCELEEKVAEKLWEYACRQDQHVLDEFGIAIVGIGALFFAYGTIQTVNVKLIVALIGFAASLFLWNDMSYARAEYDAVMKKLATYKEPFVEALLQARAKSDFLKNRYQPSTTLVMSYFMLLAAWGWTVIIVYRGLFDIIHGPGLSLYIPGWVSDSAFWILFFLSIVIVGFLGSRLVAEKITRRSNRESPESVA